MSYNNVYDHIRKKVVTVNVNNPKANWGARLIRQFMDLDFLDRRLKRVILMTQKHFRITGGTNVSGEVGLSKLSQSIGKSVARDLAGYKEEGVELLVDEVRMGDLFIESLVLNGYLAIEFRKNEEETCYIVSPTDRWVYLIDDITLTVEDLEFTKFEPYTDGCVIKGTPGKRLQDAPWCRSAMKLMKTPWKINKPVYEALRASKGMFVSDTPIEVVDDFTKKQEQRRVSKLTDFKVIEKIASCLAKDGRDFYQEMEADYRGRMYFNESSMCYQGSDWARGILLFGEGKELTPEGEYWMAVHTACSFNQSYDINELPEWAGADYRSYLQSEGLESISVDKFTLDDRVRWFNANRDWIVDAGRDRRFYPDCEKPVSFLACCIEWEGILDRGVSVSHLPIPIDGSNNGWQHLGAMSKDPRTGELVGLVAQDIQRDFYVSTAKQLLEINDEKLNAMPMKHIRKGVSKRGSMTRAYSAGAGKIGENMWFDCRSEEFDQKYGIEEKDCKKWANELIKAINVVCPGPLETMKYLQELASFHIGTYKKYRDGQPAGKEYFEIRRELTHLFSLEERDVIRISELLKEIDEFYPVLTYGNGESRIRWTTPSGFQVKYESYRMEKQPVRATIAKKQYKHILRVPTDIPDMRGYMCGISPNYVHSQDAAHMALVIDEWDGAFGAVHDSFSTHACDVEDLLALTKDKFVQMYDVENYFDKIQQDITGGTDNIQQPTRGTLDVSGVHDSDYFFA